MPLVVSVEVEPRKVSEVERFSLLDGTRRLLLVEMRERKERAVKDFEPRRTCSVYKYLSATHQSSLVCLYAAMGASGYQPA